MTRDYFAELFVAGLFADAGWNVYFPHRDKGFDFIVTKQIDGVEKIRPVQVKGKYPTSSKRDKVVFGYRGALSKVHPEMVLAIPFFNVQRRDSADLVAYMPFSMIKPHGSGYRCEPATYQNGLAVPRRDFNIYFNNDGLVLLELGNQ